MPNMPIEPIKPNIPTIKNSIKMPQVIIIFLIFAAIELSVGFYHNNTMSWEIAIAAISTAATTLFGVRYIFRDIIKSAKENAAERAMLKQKLEDSQKISDERVKRMDASFMTFSLRMDKTEEETNKRLDKIESEMTQKFDKIENEMAQKFDKFESEMTQKFDKVEKTLDKISETVSLHSKILARLDERTKQQ